MAQGEFLPLCDVLFNIISLASYFCDVVFDVVTIYTLYENQVRGPLRIVNNSGQSIENTSIHFIFVITSPLINIFVLQELVWFVLCLSCVLLSLVVCQLCSFKWYISSLRKQLGYEDCNLGLMVLLHFCQVSCSGRETRVFLKAIFDAPKLHW